MLKEHCLDKLDLLGACSVDILGNKQYQLILALNGINILFQALSKLLIGTGDKIWCRRMFSSPAAARDESARHQAPLPFWAAGVFQRNLRGLLEKHSTRQSSARHSAQRLWGRVSEFSQRLEGSKSNLEWQGLLY